MTAKTRTKELTGKQKAFIKTRIDHPTKSNAEQVRLAGYNVKDSHSGSQVANDLLKNPEVKMQLAKHADVFESVISGTAKDWGKADAPRKREIALNAAMFGHDKVFGKATVKIQQEVSVVRIAIDLTGSKEEPPKEFIESETD